MRCGVRGDAGEQVAGQIAVLNEVTGDLRAYINLIIVNFGQGDPAFDSADLGTDPFSR